MIKILFVCHGNICRSPMAQFIFQKIIDDHALKDEFLIDSCATSREEIGNGLYYKTKEILKNHHIPYDNHIARQITYKDYENFDHIIIMDKNNEYNIKRIIPNDNQHKIKMLNDKDVYDPWYSDDFETAFKEIYEGCEKLFVELTGANFKEITIDEFSGNIIRLFRDYWGIITTNDPTHNKVNAMTAAWIQMGYIWNKPVISLYIRKERYTFDLIENEDYYSLAFFKNNKEATTYLGRHSGRDEDKLANCNLTTSLIDGVPVINEADLVFILKKLYVEDLKDECFIDNDVNEHVYKNKDYHRIYVSEIVKILRK